jgi:hypothetical protein
MQRTILRIAVLVETPKEMKQVRNFLINYPQIIEVEHRSVKC